MNEKVSYLTVSKSAEGLFKERGSKFISFAMCVKNEDDVKSNLEGIRKIYHNARHHCYAYLLGPEGTDFKANDDGEPLHSAGDPILGQIRSRKLTNVLVVVVRYFGGTKLGISGLIHAYKTAASEALDQAGKKKIEITRLVVIQYNYDLTNEIMPLIRNHRIVKQEFTDTCSLEVEVNEGLLETFLADLKVVHNKNKAVTFQVQVQQE